MENFSEEGSVDEFNKQQLLEQKLEGLQVAILGESDDSEKLKMQEEIEELERSRGLGLNSGLGLSSIN